jgi:hypothetical protein
LLHCFMKYDTSAVIHLVKLIDATYASIR